MSTQFLNSTKIIEAFSSTLSTLRTGRVNSTVLDSVDVEMYGSKMKIKELATVTMPEPAQLLITAFDKGANKAIVDAITKSNLNINPVDDGAGIRLNFPPLNEETRKMIAKNVHKALEDIKIVIRNARQDILKKIKAQLESKEISEDEKSAKEKDLQKEVDDLNKKVEQIAKDKEADIMKI
jgi:ribosome recycling factor